MNNARTTAFSPFAVNQGMTFNDILNWSATFMGISMTFPSFMTTNPLIEDALKLLFLGSIVEFGRRLVRWIMGRFTFRYSISGEFKAGNPTYEWLVTYMTEEKVWRNPQDFLIETKSSRRKWKMDIGSEENYVDYIPSYGSMQFFRWNGYIMEVKSSLSGGYIEEPAHGRYGSRPDSMFLTIYTRNHSVLFSFVEECRLRYMEKSKDNVTVHSVGGRGYDGDGHWGTVKTKKRRPLDSVLLDNNVIGSLLEDAREFLELEGWYSEAGIPHRRGYLLHGPPGTGKTSTVYTIAGELGLEIYSLSLSSAGMHDDQLSQAVSSLPRRGILLIEDIDCAFPSREDEEEEWSDYSSFQRPNRRRGTRYAPARSQITLSGLLNVLDGIGSEEGKIFFATTNHVDRLDSALLRPGRIDRQIEYKLASKSQARSLFTRFFPASRFGDPKKLKIGKHFELQYAPNTDELADAFAKTIPEDEFSVAQLQGYVLDHKMRPLDAVRDIEGWVENERELQRKKEAREQARKEKMAATRFQEQMHASSAMIAGIGSAFSRGNLDSVPFTQPRSPLPSGSLHQGEVLSVKNSESNDGSGTNHVKSETLYTPPKSPISTPTVSDSEMAQEGAVKVTLPPSSMEKVNE